MKIIAVSMVKDEADIIRSTIEHLLPQVDHVIVADNNSTDDTRDILETLPIEIVDDPDPAYWQATKMTQLAHQAIRQGADWVIPFDADELWSGEHESMRDVLMNTLSATVLAIPYNFMACTADNPDELDPVRRMNYRGHKQIPLPKVAVRGCLYPVLTQGNHTAEFNTAQDSGLLIRHYPIRSAEQWERKVRNGVAALQRATGLPESSGQHWRDWGRLLEAAGNKGLREAFNEHWLYEPDQLVHDPYRGAS